MTKHRRLTRHLHTAWEPSFGDTITMEGLRQGGWRLGLTIHHGPHTYDALDFAERAIAAWRQQLAVWRLI